MSNKTNNTSFEDVYVHDASVASLLRFLREDVPYVWILGHYPNTTVEWWETEVPLNAKGDRATAEVRLIGYDIQLPTAEFLERASSFERNGITLIQSRKKMPDTLACDRNLSDLDPKILRINGAFMHIELPHQFESAMVRCFEAGYLEKFKDS